MRINKLLLAATAAVVLTTAGAAADNMDRDHRPDQGMAMHRDGDNMRGHDRYWRQGYHGYVGRDVFYRSLRAHHFYRWAGDPYWYQGRYVIRSYDPAGRVVFVELNPYTGGFIGVVRF